MKQYIINESVLYELIKKSNYLEWLEHNNFDIPSDCDESLVQEYLEKTTKYEIEYCSDRYVPYDANKLEDDLK